MFRYRILKFLGHHFYPEEPSGITVGGIPIHRILIGELFKRSTCGSFLYNDFLETVDLGNGQSGTIQKNITGPVVDRVFCFEHFISHITDGKYIALILPQQPLVNQR